MVRTKKIILFDFDGTLADSLKENIKIANVLAKRFGFHHIEDTEIEVLRGMTAGQIMKLFKIPFYKLPFLVKAFYEYRLGQIPEMVKEMGTVISELKEQGFLIGVVSSNSRERIELFLKRYDVRGVSFIHSEKNFFGKDRAIKQVLKKYNIDKEKVIYVGDEVRDIEAARKAGIEVVSVTWGFNTKELLLKNNPTYIIDKPGKLLTLLS